MGGFSSQKQELQVNFFNDFQGHPHTMAELLTFEIFSRHLQVSNVNIEVVAELKGLRQLMYKHPWLSAIFGIGTNTIVLFLIIFVSWTRFLSSDNQELHEESHQVDVSPDQGEV